MSTTDPSAPITSQPDTAPCLERILLATDGSPTSRVAEDLLLALALPSGTAVRVMVATAARDWDVSEYLQLTETTWGEHVAAGAIERLGERGLTISREISDGDPAHEILRAADSFDADLIVVGSKGRSGLAGWLLGSVARNVVRHSRRPVVVARPLRRGLSRVLLATDGSAHAEHAQRYLGRLPLPEDAQVSVAHVLRPYTPYLAPDPFFPGALDEVVAKAVQERRADADALLATAAAGAAQPGRTIHPVLLHGDPAHELLALAADSQPDLIVAGARGVSALEGLMFGSVADRLVKHAPCSVLIVP